MEIKLDKDFLDIDGKILNAERECCVQKSNGDLAKSNGQLVTIMVPTPDEKVTLKTVCIQSLLAEYPNEPLVDPDEKYKKYKLFQRFDNANGSIELEAEDIVIIKKWVGKYCNTLVQGQAWDMLEEK